MFFVQMLMYCISAVSITLCGIFIFRQTKKETKEARIALGVTMVFFFTTIAWLIHSCT
jgi:hypothetical protein